MDQGLEVVSSEGGKSLNQSGGSTVEPSLEQNQSNFPKTGSETGPKTGSETGSRTELEPILSNSSARMESIYVDPRPWKHQISHPLD